MIPGSTVPDSILRSFKVTQGPNGFDKTSFWFEMAFVRRHEKLANSVLDYSALRSFGAHFNHYEEKHIFLSKVSKAYLGVT